MTDADRLEPEHWLERHGRYLFRYALATLREERLAEDAVQDCLLAALEAQRSYSGKSSERTWLTGILKHKIVDTLRRHSRETPVEDIEGEAAADAHPDVEDMFDETGHWAHRLADWGDPVAAFEQKRFWQILEYCLTLMPARLAQLFMLREVAGSDTESICQEMAITPTNLWTMLYRSRMSLRQCLDRHWASKEGTAC